LSGTPSPDQKKLQDRLKKEAGISAVDLVHPGMVLGLGTGSTAKYALEEIALRLRDGRLSDIRHTELARDGKNGERAHAIPIL
jgi:ribose 5-phosphate isomerase A